MDSQSPLQLDCSTYVSMATSGQGRVIMTERQAEKCYSLISDVPVHSLMD